MNNGAKGALAAAVALLVAIPVLLVAVLAGTSIDCDPAGADSGGGAAGTSSTAGQKTRPMKKGTYQMTSPFGMRGGEMHKGQDFGSTAGQPMYAAFDGTVSKAGPADGFGQWIVLSHNINGTRYDTVYGHMFAQDLMVKPGQKVVAGQQIAKVGYNGQVSPPGPGGAHLHFEVWQGGWGQQPIDPMAWLGNAPEPGGTAPAPAAPRAPPPAPDGGGGEAAGGDVVTVADWNAIAEHESGGNWAINTGNGYYGGLQFSASTWAGFGGTKFAPTADKATPAQQREVANTTLKAQGWDAWPVTSRKAGVRGKKPAPPGTFLTGGPAGGPAEPGTPAPAPVADSGGTLDLSAPMPARLGSEANWQTNSVRLARALAQRFPELQRIGGWRADGGGISDHPDGRAVDIMMPGGGRTPADIALGDRIARYVMDNKDVYAVEYLIWRQKYQPAQGAGNQMPDRGGWTANHMDHVHVTLNPSARYSGGPIGPVRDRAAAGAPGGSAGDTCDGAPAGTPGGNPNATNVVGVPRDWARWYNQAGRICPQISPSLLASQGNQETGGFKATAVSPDAAKGPGQFIDSTWATYGKDYDRDGRVDVYSLGDAIMAQGQFMCDIARQVDGWVSAGQVDERSGPNRDRRDLYLAAYNAGPGSVQSSRGFPNQVPRHFTETRPYAQIIIANEPKYRGTLADAR